MGPKKLLLDCDAGTDDAQAIMIALAHQDKAKIIAITTVFGNGSVEDTSRNVLRVLNFCKRTDIPVFSGCRSSLIGTPSICKAYHGHDAFGDIPDLYGPGGGHIQEENGSAALARLAKEHKGELTLVAIGPLTNIATAHKLDADFLKNLKELYIMGGNTTGRGNITPAAEFNFCSDPEAAQYLLSQAEKPTYLFPLELCETFSFDWSWYENFCKIPTEKAKFIKDIESVMVRGAKKKGLPKYWTWDQLAVSAALDESIILETKDVWAAVELCGQYTRGQVVIDWRNRDKKPEKITIVTRVDGEKYEKMILSAVK